MLDAFEPNPVLKTPFMRTMGSSSEGPIFLFCVSRTLYLSRAHWNDDKQETLLKNQTRFTSHGLGLCLAGMLCALALASCQQTAGEVPPQAAPRPKPLELNADRGALWMPVTWTLRLSQGAGSGPSGETSLVGDPISQLRFRRVALVWRNLQTRAEVVLPGALLDPKDPESADRRDGSNTAVLSLEVLSRTFAFDPVVVLPEGRYVLEAVRGEAGDDKSARPTVLSLPLPNPLSAEDESPLYAEVQRGVVSVLGRMAFETVVGSKSGRIVASTRGESLESGRIAEPIMTKDLRWDPNLAGSRAPRLIKGHPMVGDLRGAFAVHGPRHKTPVPEGMVALALAVESSCQSNGHLKLVWKADGDTKEHVSMLPLDAPVDGQTTCNAAKDRLETFFTLWLPQENWLLQATEVVPKRGFVSTSKLDVLAHPSASVRRYFGIEDAAKLVFAHAANEQQIRRRFYLPLKQLRGAPGVLYFGGRFAVVPTQEAQETSGGVTKSGGLWSVALRKNYQLSVLKEAFGRDAIWNPFTGTPMEADGKEGRIEATLQVSSAVRDSKALEPFLASLRKTLTESFARCVQRHEESDPLLVGKAHFKFQIKARQLAATLDDLTLHPSSETESLVLCFRREFDAFRFSRPVPAAFNAEMDLLIK